MAQRVLVTGGHGYIGQHLVKKLKDLGFDVYAPDRLAFDLVENNIIWEEYDYCFHLAGTTHNYHILNDSTLDFETNCVGLIRLLEQLPKHCRFVNISTFFVNHGSPRGLYGASKLAAEHILSTYKNVYGLNYITLRLPNVYGPGEVHGSSKKGSLNWMIQRVVNGENLTYYAGEARREFIYIDDCVNQVIGWGLSDYSGLELDIPGYPMKMGDFIKLIDPDAKEVETPEFHKQVGITDYSSRGFVHHGICPEEGIRLTKEHYVQLCSA